MKAHLAARDTCARRNYLNRFRAARFPRANEIWLTLLFTARHWVTATMVGLVFASGAVRPRRETG